MKKLTNLMLSFSSVVIVMAFTVVVAILSKFYFNVESPIGDEVFALMGKMMFIANNFPHFGWYLWEAGQPGFWVYLPFAFFVGDLLVKFMNFTYAHSIMLIGLISYLCIAVGVYGITYRLAKNHITSILAAFLAITSQGVWYWDGSGYYARTFGMGFYFLALWAGIAFIQKIEKQENFFPIPKLEFLSTLVFFFLAGYSHALSNNLTIGTLALLFLVSFPGWHKKILSTVFVIGTGILLSAFYFFLMWQANIQYYNNYLIRHDLQPHPLRLLWNLSIFEGYSGAPEVSPLILPLVVILLLWLIFFGRKFKGFTSAEKRISIVIFSLFVICLYYPLQGSLFFPRLFYILFLPGDATFFISIFGAILVGALLTLFLRSIPKLWQFVVPGVLIGIVVLLTVQGKLFVLEDKWMRRAATDDKGFMQQLVIDPQSKQYRMGTIWPEAAESFNYYYKVPQSHGYFISAGGSYNDWQFWLNSTVWDKKYGYPETDFLIDWYSIKWIIATHSPSDSSFEKFNANPESYDLVYPKNGNIYFEFSPKKNSPILSVTNAPNILIIGQEKSAYELFVRSEALVNLNSQYLIPVRGRAFIDDYSLDELKQFNIIYLYEYRYKNKDKAGLLLKNYVEQGGGLIIEGMLSPEAKNQQNQVLFNPLPQTKIRRLTRLDEWKFDAKDSEITQGVDFNIFDRAIYEETDPWKIVSLDSIDNFDTILKSDGDPIVLTSELGEGRIIWMGMNLNFHISANKNAEEMKFFKNIINWVSKGEMNQIQAAEYETQYIHPQRREITVKNQSRAILNKEYYFPPWKAYLRQDNKDLELKIYRGGLDQQYILLPSEYKAPYTVILEYGWWPIEKVGLVISIVTAMTLIIYLFEGLFYPPIIRRAWHKTFGRIGLNTGSWWEKDEE